LEKFAQIRQIVKGCVAGWRWSAGLEEAKVKWIAGEEAACSGGEETDRQRRGREGFMISFIRGGAVYIADSL
jgi:hypothetical protein